MQFMWYWALSLLASVPLLVTAYVLAQRRRSRFALRYASLLVFNEIKDKRPGLRRHGPAAFLFLAFTSMLIAVARPTIVIPMTKGEKTIVLAIDTSGSMSLTDIKPARLAAAKVAAISFVGKQDPTVRIGIVAFSESAALVQVPTTDHATLTAAINRLDIQSSTAIGSGILASLDAILKENGLPSTAAMQMGNTTPPTQAAPGAANATQVPAAIVLLTDGQNDAGPDPLEAAKQATTYGVSIFTVGIGTTSRGASGAVHQEDLDEPTLIKIADTTHARYFRATDEASLAGIYQNLPLHFASRVETIEITPEFTALAFVLVLCGWTLSVRWFAGLP